MVKKKNGTLDKRRTIIISMWLKENQLNVPYSKTQENESYKKTRTKFQRENILGITKTTTITKLNQNVRN